MATLWFKRKTYGYGWTPATKEGWWVIVVYTLFVTLSGIYFVRDAATVADIALFCLSLVAASAILIGVCIKKGETPRWQWGERTDEIDAPHP
jgi:predicted anti-sigma-YlaC factor YlaD